MASGGFIFARYLLSWWAQQANEPQKRLVWALSRQNTIYRIQSHIARITNARFFINTDHFRTRRHIRDLTRWLADVVDLRVRVWRTWALCQRNTRSDALFTHIAVVAHTNRTTRLAIGGHCAEFDRGLAAALAAGVTAV